MKTKKRPQRVVTGCCDGSYKVRQSTKGRRISNGTVRYPCPVCNKHIGCDPSGNFNKHGWKYQMHMVSVVESICAECGQKFNGIDYLCERCRDDSA